MKNCTDCKHADWQRTAAGRLHASGQGECKFVFEIPQLRQSMYWFIKAPQPIRASINRRKELPDHCVYWSRKD